MTAIAVRQETQVDTTQLVSAIREARSLPEAQDARGRIEAARAWAKVHGQAKRLRLEILSLEVEALTRIFQLGGKDVLTAREWIAAEWLSSLTPNDRERIVADSPGNITTASGLAHRLMSDERAEVDWATEWDRGVRLATGAGADAVSFESEHATNSRRSMAEALEWYATNGNPFTVAEMAEDVIADMGTGGMISDHPALRDGIKEVCRKAIASARVDEFDGIHMPRFITAAAGETYVRIPTMNATVDQLGSMISMRREQIRQDIEAVESLERLHAALSKKAGGETSIASIIARSR